MPASLQIEHPYLTTEGKQQALLLRKNLPLNENNVLIVSPILRTLPCD
ncbi:Protein of unknown function [Bacillus cytotoxicus]|uniref:Uncharacterized protein n=1 Tax=Bacillus cytotoxicus TaxID=580165 RepID=A0AAX2CKW7_9BACI|nr:Protein of unknown function [Bacillus cytotoxicus]SCN41469.1 Protein of unknown function [Bacillus cytotoxicus]